LFVLNFWAAWCSPCKQMNDVFEQLSKSYQQIGFLQVSSSRLLTTPT
jgi:thiol-disulfide isomerase/thioredoxin